MVESYETLEKYGLIDQRMVTIEKRQVSYRRLFKWVKFAARDPQKQLISGSASITLTATQLVLNFYSHKFGIPEHLIEISLELLNRYRFRARLEAVIRSIPNSKSKWAKIYFYSSPKHPQQGEGPVTFQIDDLENLVICPFES